MGQKGILRTLEGGQVSFYCPGCKESHVVRVESKENFPCWGFNNDYDKPTFTPSILVRSGHYVPGYENQPCWCTFYKENPAEGVDFVCKICHSFVNDGNIQFLSDCTHELAGQTVPLTAKN